jgi:ribosome biogenesis GTPase / thiamine phosphate phosphatase
VSQQGTVVEYHREYCLVRLAPDGPELLAKPRAQLKFSAQREEKDWRKEGRLVFEHQFAVGDEVELEPAADGNAVITAVQPRQTWLFRDVYKRTRPLCLVANADQLAVVVAPNPWVKLAVVDRLLLAALQGGLAPLLVVNKVDLDPGLPDSVEFAAYRQLGYPLLFTSALSGAGLEQLPPLLSGKLTAFCGHSGVGKSSLLSGLTGLSLKTGEVNPETHKGRYTTETSRIYELAAGGGRVVDTPGVRSFGLSRLEWTDVNEYFADIAQLALGCGFNDCRHSVEPGCAVQQAVACGELSAQRVESYVKLRAECEAWKHWA